MGAGRSAADEAAVVFAFTEATPRGLPLHAVHAWSHPLSRNPGDMVPLVFEPVLIRAEE